MTIRISNALSHAKVAHRFADIDEGCSTSSRQAFEMQVEPAVRRRHVDERGCGRYGQCALHRQCAPRKRPMMPALLACV